MIERRVGQNSSTIMRETDKVKHKTITSSNRWQRWLYKLLNHAVYLMFHRTGESTVKSFFFTELYLLQIPNMDTAQMRMCRVHENNISDTKHSNNAPVSNTNIKEMALLS